MALPFGRAVMQIEANDDQLRRDLKDAERIVETSTANMQADLSGLTVATNKAGGAMGNTSQAAGVLASGFSLVGGRASLMAGQVVSLSLALRALVVSTAAADAAIVSLARAALVAVAPLAKVAAAITAVAAVLFAGFKIIEFVTGTKQVADEAERAEKAFEKMEARLASRQLAKISEAKVLAEQAKIKEEALQKELAIAKQLEQVEKKRLAEAAALLKQLEAQRDAKRAAFIAAAGPQTAAGAQRAIADLIRLNQGQQRAMELLKEAAAALGPAVTKLLTDKGLLGTPEAAEAAGAAGSVNFVRAGAFSAATLARGSLGGTSGRKQQVRDSEANGTLKQMLTEQQRTNSLLTTSGGGGTSN